MQCNVLIWINWVNQALFAQKKSDEFALQLFFYFRDYCEKYFGTQYYESFKEARCNIDMKSIAIKIDNAAYIHVSVYVSVSLKGMCFFLGWRIDLPKSFWIRIWEERFKNVSYEVSCDRNIWMFSSFRQTLSLVLLMLALNIFQNFFKRFYC